MSIDAIKVRGPFRGISGYDHHVREFVREFVRQGVAVELTDLPEWGPARLQADEREPLFELLTEPVGAQVSLQFCMPHQLKRDDRRPTVNYTMFESTRITPAWVSAAATAHITVLPTESSRQAWLASGVAADRIRICPLGVRGELFAEPHDPLPIVLPDGRSFSSFRTRFLNVSEWGTRKNVVGLFRTWLQSTTASDDAVLLIKLGCYAPEAERLFRVQLDLVQRVVRRSLADAAPVHVMIQTLSDSDMARLFASATHYWSMSHGEGWDLPMTEAIATGLTPIAPDHSAYRDYLDPTVALMIPSREEPVRMPEGWPIGNLFAGSNWWKPDESAAGAILRGVIDGRLEPVASARDRILGEFSWARSTARLIEILDEAVTEPAGRRRWSLPFRRH